MPVTRESLIILPITAEMKQVASYISKKRWLFEYPREGYGDYDTRGTKQINIGTLGELCFLEFVFSYLEKQFGEIKSKDRWEVLHKKVKFAYSISIGTFDEGFEFMLGGKTIDIKTYENRTVTIEQIFKGLNERGRPLSLFVDKTQNTKADYYVQVFIMPKDKICIAGYHEGLPPLAKWMPNEAYTCPVPDLISIQTLLNKIQK